MEWIQTRRKAIEGRQELSELQPHQPIIGSRATDGAPSSANFRCTPQPRPRSGGIRGVAATLSTGNGLNRRNTIAPSFERSEVEIFQSDDVAKLVGLPIVLFIGRSPSP